MASYRICFKRSVAKDLRGLPKKDVKSILACIDALAEDPRTVGAQKLSGSAYYRVRQGLYLIVYEILDDALIVQVIKVVHGSTVYRR
jgi:mRNA interferase RelE/StbE